MQNKSTTSETHSGSINVDNVNRDKKKDKSKVTYYNYGKTGHYKNEYRTEKKDWISVFENKIKSVNMARRIYNIVSELKIIKFKLLLSKPVKEIKIITKDKIRKYDKNVE
jgi:hypothetical protein